MRLPARRCIVIGNLFFIKKCDDEIHMDLKQIQYFIALFEDGSVTRAAKRLNIVQPALSMQIARLEEELQQQLFERTSQGMTPTAEGRLMYRLYLPIVKDLANARLQLVRRGEMVTGHLSVGLLASVSESVLPDVLSRFHAQYPQVELSIFDGYSATFIDWINSGQIDVALINRPRTRLSLDAVPLLDEEMVLATSAVHGPELPASIELARLSELELVLPTKRHGLRAVLDTAAQHEDLHFSPRFEIDVMSAIVKFVEETRFATILPPIAVERAVRLGRLRSYPILAPRIVRHIIAVTHPRRPLNAAASAFVNIIKEELQRVSGESSEAKAQKDSGPLAPAPRAGPSRRAGGRARR
jgi:DNA-binding transcriptional LysR family regulator